MKIEKALYISPFQLERINHLPDKISYVYIGSDSCEHMMPSPSDIKKLMEMGKEAVVSVPILTDFFLDKLCSDIKNILEFKENIEISVNDIGTLVKLHSVFGSKLRLSVGRHLFSLWAKNSFSYTEKMSHDFSISFFEIDDAHTADSFLESNKFNIAYHYPFKYYSLTRICAYRKGIFQSCERICHDVYIPLDDGRIIWRGNAYFTKNNAMPRLLPQRLIISYDLTSYGETK